MNPLQKQIDDIIIQIATTHDKELLEKLHARLLAFYRLLPDYDEN